MKKSIDAHGGKKNIVDEVEGMNNSLRQKGPSNSPKTKS